MRMTAGAGSGEGRMQNSKMTGKMMKKKKKKKKGKFPDMSGDGKVTKKDILIARGVIKKKGKKRRWKRKKTLDVWIDLKNLVELMQKKLTLKKVRKIYLLRKKELYVS